MQGYFPLPLNLEKPSVFDGMTPEEFNAVTEYMFQQHTINLTPIEEAMPNCSYIYLIELQLPLKSAVLEFLDRGSVRVKRAAKVVVVRGDLEHPKVEEYLVAPLPRPNFHRVARNPSYARFPIPYTSRPMDQVDYRYVYPIITEFTKSVYHILLESYGLCYHNCTKGHNCMIFRDTAPRGRQSGDRSSWFRAYRDVEGYFLHPLGLELQINHASPDITKWFIERVSYGGHLMYTTQDFIERYESNNIQKIRLLRNIVRPEQLFSSYNRRGAPDMSHPKQGPRVFYPEGARFLVSGQHVNYMNWDFDLHMRSSTGIQIFDVRFQGERIAYEISLQDGITFTSGYAPSQIMTKLYLASWMIGASSFELVRGVDCPDAATFIDSIHFVNSGVAQQYRSSICVFEQNPGVPLRRHYSDNQDGGYFRYGGIVDYQLVVRHIASILKSDYIFDYVFHLNGEIELRVSPTGYVQSSFKIPFEAQFGNPLHYDVTGNVHQHMFHFKIDLDIRRVENRFSVLEIDTQSARHPWYPDVNLTQFMIKEKEYVREMDIVIDELSLPNYYIIYDEQPLNEFGSRRAYRILNNGMTPFMLENEDVANAARWTKYPVVVTKYDDTEETSSSIYAQNEPWDPVVDFEGFVQDNDTIFNEDLVVWATMGLYHIPSTEDVPSSATTWQTQSIHIVPFNFFNECPSVTSVNNVKLEPVDNYDDVTSRLKVKVNTYGTSQQSDCAPVYRGPTTYYGFRDEV